MAASSVSRQMPTNLAFEDYSVYGHLSEEELIHLAIERSLTDTQGGPSQSAQPAHQSTSSPPLIQAEPSNYDGMAAFRESRRQYAEMRRAAMQTQTVSPCSEGQKEKKRSEHSFAGDRERMLAWKRRNGSLEATERTMDDASKLNSAIWKNDSKTLSEILRTVPATSLCKPNKDGWIHLHEAAYYGALECLEPLIQAFPQLINARTNKNQNPLILAVSHKHLLCAQCLLAAGGDPNIANKSGETAVLKACEKASVEMVELLLKAGGNASRGNLEGVTPLHEAVGAKSVAMCKLLVEAGAKIWAKNIYGIEPLFTAAQAGATEALNFLIKHGGNINTQANDGATALYEASKNGHEEVVKLLLSKRADMNKATKAGLTPLHVASKNGHLGVVLLLLPRTNRAVVRRCGISPLHLAAERNRDAILEILIEAGFDVNTQLSLEWSKMYEDRRTTALYFTVRSSNVEATSMLLEAGADPNLDIFNPLLVAVRKGNTEMTSLLMEYGANVNACMPTHPTTFPGALLFCMKYRRMFKLLLDNGCDANACFACVYGNGTHPPVKSRRSTREDLYLHGLDAPHTTTAQFCEVMADPFHCAWAGTIIDLLLDYVGHVKLCSRLTDLLDSNKDWEYIKEKARPPFSLIHLCRVRIRELVGWQRLRRMTSLPLPGRLIKYLFYDNGESEDFLNCG
ncbi:ankyrin repeat and SOCS box protein 2-like [Sardina pilchardus]|uniref:ankyrin repeat and SOCS box protein 2-like n=1 Tax=Sardina pilchardus TaxID=27697 RepID=UPI002E157F2A